MWETFDVNLILCFFFIKNMKAFSVLAISFLKLCANWVHVSLRIVNSSSLFSLNVFVCCYKNLLLKKSEIKQP